jgi:hypothetical protein
MNEEEVVNDLTYINYKHNREISPHVTPKNWELIYGEHAVKRMERAYTQERLGEVFSDDSIPYNTEGGE